MPGLCPLWQGFAQDLSFSLPIIAAVKAVVRLISNAGVASLFWGLACRVPRPYGGS